MASRSRTLLRSPSTLIMLALLLPLLAACGGGMAAQNSAAPPTHGPAEVAAGGLGAAATSAPAAMMATSAPASESAGLPVADAGTAEEAAAPIVAAVPTSVPVAGGVAARPTPPPAIPNEQQATPLKASVVDDNADFATYLEYLRAYSGPPARQIDISERYILTVLNGQQQPVLDARVRLFDGDTQVFEGRTYAGGKTIVFPRTLGLSDNIQTLRVLVEKGNSTTGGQLTRGQDSTQSFVLHDAQPLPATPRLDLLFLLDATGSMGDEIAQIQQTIVSIAGRIDAIEPRPELRFALVSYRDRGDDYVTRVGDFTNDVQAFRQLLLDTYADGGGDEPESLNEGLHAAVQRVSWADDALRLVFLVADAPPHLDYEQDYDYLREARTAVAKGVKVYPIAASNTDQQAEYIFRQIAQQTLGRFIFLTYQPGQSGGTPGDTSTLDAGQSSFTVERLDDLVVLAVQSELAMARGVA
jgi:hypothetical protein